MKKTEFLPIILGSDENAYGCARLFYEEYGIRSLLLCSRALSPTVHSGILTERVIKNFDAPEVFGAVIGELLPALKSRAERLLLIPCSDYYVGLTVKNRKFISEYSSAPVLREELYGRLFDKASFYALCRETGLPYPETVIMSAEELLSAPAPFNFPIVVKPANSNSFSYLHLCMENRRKVYFCKNIDELRSVAGGLFRAGYREGLAVQRYIPGDRALVINAYCDKNGRVRLIGAAEPILEYRAPSLLGNYAALRTGRARDICDEAAAFLEKIGYTGFANLDLKFDARLGRYVFLELNPRQGRSSYCMHTAGENLMKALCDDAVYGKEYTGITYAESEGVWRNIPRFLLYKHTELSLSESLRAESALGVFFDFSPLRAYTLIRRDVGSARLLREE